MFDTISELVIPIETPTKEELVIPIETPTK